MKRTDKSPITYPPNISSQDRHFTRRICNNTRDFILANKWQGPITIAFSGGKDSVVLLDICHKVSLITGIGFITVYVNHGLRPKENYDEIGFYNFINKKYGFCGTMLNAFVDKGPGLEVRARDKRYKALASVGNITFTAHHADDDLETIIMRLMDKRYNTLEDGKSFQRVVFGMKQQSLVHGCHIARPLLKYSRDDLARYAKIFELTWCEDSSNATDDYTRNKIRHHVVPLMKKIKASNLK